MHVETRQKSPQLSFTASDFDETLFAVSASKDSESLTINLFIPYFKSLEKFGVTGFLKGVYGDMLLPSPEKNYSVSLTVDLQKIPDDFEALAHNLSLLKRNCFASVMQHHFTLLSRKQETPFCVLKMHSAETLSLRASSDYVVIYLSIEVENRDDFLLARGFFSEFASSAKRPGVSSLTMRSFTDEVPELANTDALTGEHVTHLSISFPLRYGQPDRVDKTIDMIYMLSTYLRYHLKCLKAYCQSRNREKFRSFMQLLNRAKIERKSAVCISDETLLQPEAVGHTSIGYTK